MCEHIYTDRHTHRETHTERHTHSLRSCTHTDSLRSCTHTPCACFVWLHLFHRKMVCVANFSCRHTCEIVDELGRQSAIAQGLKRPVTSSSSIRHGDRVYLLTESGGGLLKVGERTLYLSKDLQLEKVVKLCVLDFYTVDQQRGNGTRLFTEMLTAEKTQPSNLAYDRPSSKLIQFLHVKFRLDNGVMNTNFFLTF